MAALGITSLTNKHVYLKGKTKQRFLLKTEGAFLILVLFLLSKAP